MIQVSAPRRQLLLGYGASLLAAIAYGSVAVVGRKIVSDFAPPLVATSFSMIFGTIILFALFHRQFASDVAARGGVKSIIESSRSLQPAGRGGKTN